jgi:hypothetical protein
MVGQIVALPEPRLNRVLVRQRSEWRLDLVADTFVLRERCAVPRLTATFAVLVSVTFVAHPISQQWSPKDEARTIPSVVTEDITLRTSPLEGPPLSLSMSTHQHQRRCACSRPPVEVR